jgi:FtsP/CotA-like multicopper oxidase with cupredoxin domain
MLAGLGAAVLMPRLAWAETDGQGFQVIRARRSQVTLLADAKTPTGVWSFVGDRQPLAIRAKQGEELKLRFFNDLDFEVWLHFFGVRGPSDLMTLNVPAGSATPTECVFTPPDAGTFWLGPMADQSRLRDMGLYALVIVEEAASPGDFTDLALTFDDWKIDDQGAIDQRFGDVETMVGEGRLGNWFTVNSRYRPSLPLPANKYARLRLANTANARTMSLQFKGGAPQVVALDGQPVTPQGLGSAPLQLAPGQRADLILAPERTINIALDLYEDTVEVAYLVQKGEGGPVPLPAGFRLPANPIATQLDMGAARHVAVRLEGGLKGGLQQALLNGQTTDLRGLLEHGFGWAINGTAGPGGPPLVEAKKGETLIFDIDNRTIFAQALHVHGHVWQEIDGTGAQAWRDTGIIPGKSTRSFAMVADNPGTWAIQALAAERADGGLMAAFRVT